MVCHWLRQCNVTCGMIWDCTGGASGTHLADGSVIHVNEPFEIATQRTGPCFIVCSGDRMDVIAYRNVTRISTPTAAS